LTSNPLSVILGLTQQKPEPEMAVLEPERPDDNDYHKLVEAQIDLPLEYQLKLSLLLRAIEAEFSLDKDPSATHIRFPKEDLQKIVNRLKGMYSEMYCNMVATQLFTQKALAETWGIEK
jgi:hypothetical protein